MRERVERQFYNPGLGATGAGKLGTTSACPSITLALCAWASNDALRCSIMASSCSSVSSLIGLLCSTLCSRRTSSARPFEVARWLLPCDLFNRLLAVLAEMQQQRLDELLI